MTLPTIPALTPSRKILLGIVALVTAFAFGRYTVSVKPNVTTITATKSASQTVADKDTHTQTQIVEVKEPTGEVKTTTTITKDTVSVVDKTRNVETQATETVSQSTRKTLNVAALVGMDVVHHLGTPVYGVSVSKELIGPVTVGVFGMSNSLVGISVSLNF